MPSHRIFSRFFGLNHVTTIWVESNRSVILTVYVEYRMFKINNRLADSNTVTYRMFCFQIHLFILSTDERKCKISVGLHFVQYYCKPFDCKLKCVSCNLILYERTLDQLTMHKRRVPLARCQSNDYVRLPLHQLPIITTDS